MTDVTRRHVIEAGVAGIAASLVAPALPPAVAATVTRSAGLYTRGRFARRLGRRFTATAGGRSVRMRLTEIRDIDGAAGRERSFVLVFTRAAAGPPQNTYLLSRSAFTATSLFLVPDEERRTYTAVVSSGSIA